MWYKKAFDKSFLENKRPTGKGAYGKYYSDFTQEELKKLKRQLGNYTPHMGIKQFHVSSLFEDIIQENLALIYFSPIIKFCFHQKIQKDRHLLILFRLRLPLYSGNLLSSVFPENQKSLS